MGNILQKIFRKEVKIALATILALCILVYGINYLKGINMFKPSTYYYVKFSDINGLAKSSPVFADGYRVGIVRDIAYDYNHPGNISVEVKLDTEMRIPEGSSAVIASNLMGGLRLNLILSRDSRNLCAIGDTILGSLDSGLMSTFSQLVPKAESMLPKLDSILNSLNAILADPSICATLHSLQSTSSNLDVASGELKEILKGDVPQLTHKLNVIGDNFITVSNNLKNVNLQASLDKVDSTLHNVKLVTDKLNSKDNTVGLLLNDKQFYDNLNTTFINASTLLDDLKANPKRYVHFSVFGKKSK
jgi:phospholipid/cholesterol/gamma-HCH transport system substrate-binding protein